MDSVRAFTTILRQAVASTLKGCQGPETGGGGGGTVTRSSEYSYSRKGEILFIILTLFPKLVSTVDMEVTGLLGQNITLPCHMEGGETEGLKVYWQQRQSQQANGDDLMVWIYKDGRVQMQYVHQYFHGRAHVSVPGIASGNLSLNLQNLQANDSGYYECVIIRSGQTTDTLLYKLTMRAPSNGTNLQPEFVRPTMNNTDVGTSGTNQRLGLMALMVIPLICIFYKCYSRWCRQSRPNSELP